MLRFPMWQFVTKWEVPKNTLRKTEDAIFCGSYHKKSDPSASAQFFAVFDGVSSGVDPLAPVPIIHGTLTPGQFAVEVGKRALLEALANYTSPRELVDYVSRVVREECQKLEEEGVKNFGRPAFTFLVFLPEYGIMVGVGDCTAMIDGVLHTNEMRIDQVKSRVRRRLLEKLIKEGVSIADLVANDPTKQLMDELGAHQQAFANNDKAIVFGYGVVNGDHVPDPFIRKIKVSGNVKRIVLATDGLPPFVLRHSLSETKRLLARLFEDDPLCRYLWKAVRGLQPNGCYPDDITYLALKAA